MNAREILKFSRYTRLGAAIALRNQAGLSAYEANEVIAITQDVHPLIGEALITGYLSGAFSEAGFVTVQEEQFAGAGV